MKTKGAELAALWPEVHAKFRVFTLTVNPILKQITQRKLCGQKQSDQCVTKK